MTDEMPDTDTYALRRKTAPKIAAPELDYRPPQPDSYRPRIGLIGAGGIAASHLQAYRDAGWDVAAICNRTLSKAEARAREFYPDARVTDDAAEIFADDSIEVVDITPHPAERVPLIEAALKAGKHVLSQKPFVLDLDTGERLADLADARGCKLAVNQNGRWAPHMAWARAAVRTGLLGRVTSLHCAVHWDHGWVAGTAFDAMDDLILYDFGIHWFDFVTSILGDRPRRVFAGTARASGQNARAPLMAQALITLDDGQASLVFDGGTPHGSHNSTYIGGTEGSLQSSGPEIGAHDVILTTAAGTAAPDLAGNWFNDGFRGAMGALLRAIEHDEEPANGARENLRSLALTFAAVRSSETGMPMDVGAVRRIKA